MTSMLDCKHCGESIWLGKEDTTGEGHLRPAWLHVVKGKFSVESADRSHVAEPVLQ